MAILKFYRKSTAPASPAQGAIWFNTENKTIQIYTGTEWEKYAGTLVDATLVDNVLTITKSDGSSVTCDFSDIASASSVVSALALKLDKSTYEAYVATNDENISDLKERVDDLEAVDIVAVVNAEIASAVSNNQDFDTLAEISAWIAAHPGDVATMNAAIQAAQATASQADGKADANAADILAIAQAYIKSVSTVDGDYVKLSASDVTSNGVTLTVDDSTLKAKIEELSDEIETAKNAGVASINGKTGAVTIDSGSANGTVSVGGEDVVVTGLGSAAYTSSDAYDANGAAAAVLGTADDTADKATVYGAKAYADSLMTWAEF